MIKIAICDDKKTHQQKAKNMIRDILLRDNVQASVSVFYSAEEMLDKINRNYIPNIAVLDIEMDGKNGIDLAKEMNKIVPDCRLIFLTAYSNYASDAYETEHVWFVIKKKADQFFPSAIHKALSSLNDSISTGTIAVKEKSHTRVIPVNQIIYLTRIQRKSLIRCVNQDFFDSRRPALLIPDELSSSFIRCHQGYWVNIDMIKELDHGEFIMKNNERIPISRTYNDHAKKQFFTHYLRK